MLLVILCISLLGNMLSGQLAKEQLELVNFEIQKYQKEPRVFSRNNLPEIKDGAYIINLDKYKSNGTHWIPLYINCDNATYFDRFGDEHIPKEFKKIILNKNVTTNIHRIQASVSMCWYFCIGFIDFILKGKSLLDYTNLFSGNKYEKNDKIIVKYFQ